MCKKHLSKILIKQGNCKKIQNSKTIKIKSYGCLLKCSCTVFYIYLGLVNTMFCVDSNFSLRSDSYLLARPKKTEFGKCLILNKEIHLRLLNLIKEILFQQVT